jgi:tripartite-type tricarboxylate transporter receptor subunit TctC
MMRALKHPMIPIAMPFVLSGLVVIAFFAGGSGWAQEFPSREIRLMVPYGPGGGVDIVARIYAEKVEKVLGVPVVIVNNAAGGGAVTTLTVAQAKPDGYTLLAATTGPLIMKPLLTPEIRYRYSDFTAVCQTVVMPVALWVQADAPWKSLKDLVDHGKKNPGKLRASVGQAGGFMEVLLNLFETEAGIDITDIPTTGGAKTSAALLGGHAELCMDAISTNINFLRGGRLRALVCTHKVAEYPQIKTFEEEGYSGVSLKLWHGVLAPKGLPKPILAKLAAAYQKASLDPSLKEQLGKLHILPDYRDPDESAKTIQRENEIILKVLRQSGLVK